MKKIITGIFITTAVLAVSVTSVWAHGHGRRYLSNSCQNTACYNSSSCGANYTDTNDDGICDNYYLKTGCQNSYNCVGHHRGRYCR